MLAVLCSHNVLRENGSSLVVRIHASDSLINPGFFEITSGAFFPANSSAKISQPKMAQMGQSRARWNENKKI